VISRPYHDIVPPKHAINADYLAAYTGGYY